MKIAGAILLFILIAIGVAAFSVYSYLAPDDDVVRIESPSSKRQITSGEVVGMHADNGAHVWLGIPYAEPPIGDNRWRAPKPVKPWEGSAMMMNFGERCVQFSALNPNLPEPIGSEDCLYLNVWAPPFPAQDVVLGEKSLPVMFWIYGGGNSIGSTSTSIYDGSRLALEHNVIVVSVNYRLGPLGWMLHPSLTVPGDPVDSSGNYGTLDLIAGLDWVQQNIRSFGGDPNNVTIFGESAGGINVMSLIASPLASGLFHKAISQSGGQWYTKRSQATNYADDDEPGFRYSAKEVVNLMLIQSGLSSDVISAVATQEEMIANNSLDNWLRARSAAEIYAVFDRDFGPMIQTPAVFLDGHVLPEVDEPLSLYMSGAYNAVPMMLGTNRDEVRLFASFGEGVVEKTLGFPTKISDFQSYARDTDYGSQLWKADAVDEFATHLVKQQREPVFAYRFDADDWRSIGDLHLKDLMGAAHGLELFFIFGKFPKPMRVLFPDSNMESFSELSDSMMSYWAQFARYGDPGNGRDGSLPLWRAWQNEGDETPRLMVFDTNLDAGIRMVPDRITSAAIMDRFLSDDSYPDQVAYCEAYKTIFRDQMFDEKVYASLGEGGCQ